MCSSEEGVEGKGEYLVCLVRKARLSMYSAFRTIEPERLCLYRSGTARVLRLRTMRMAREKLDRVGSSTISSLS